MLTTMAVSLLGVLLLGVVNGYTTGDVVQLSCSASALVLVLFRLRDEAKLEIASGSPAPRTAEDRISPHGEGIRTGEGTLA
jgi:hypothetical protein